MREEILTYDTFDTALSHYFGSVSAYIKGGH
jgi:hypothetical protein